MAATRYQVLYRYINEATNTPIINDMNNKYEPVCEFYSDPHHKIFFDDDPVSQADATNEQQELISFGNSSDNPKNNMLFAYDGTKKVKHPQWIPETVGYVVRDWKQLKRSLIGNKGDFTKDFTTIDALTPEDGGTVVCTEKIRDKYFKTIVVVKDNGQADKKTNSGNPYYSKEKIEKMIVDSTFFALTSTQYQDYTQDSRTDTLYIGYNNVPYYTGPVAIENNQMAEYTDAYKKTVYGQPTKDNLYASVTVNASHIQTAMIPGHYEESTEAPYLIIDTYKRIQLSPWFVNYTCSSLESAISKARVLVDMVGIENVKVIKVVPFDQFVKIK
jgi:hypothetical protein